MPKIEVSVVIKADKDAVYKTIQNMEDFPNFMRDIKSLRIIKRKDNSIVTLWEAEIDGAPVNWKEEDNFDDVNYEVKFNMIEGNYNAYQGKWLIEDHPKGAKLTLTADFDWGIPILEKYVGKTLEEKARLGLLGMLHAIKNKVEESNV